MGSVYDYYYENYLMLYGLYGRGRPRVNRQRFEELDRELLAMVTAMSEDQVDQKVINRSREIEYILLDDISEALLDPVRPVKDVKKATESADGRVQSAPKEKSEATEDSGNGATSDSDTDTEKDTPDAGNTDGDAGDTSEPDSSEEECKDSSDDSPVADENDAAEPASNEKSAPKPATDP